jgi:hypothetical protein
VVLGALLVVSTPAVATDDTGQSPPRRRPGATGGAAPAAEAPAAESDSAPQRTSPPAFVPVPDRWRLVERVGVNERWWDPYRQNTWKADRPILGNHWFVNLALSSESTLEARRLPTTVGIQATDRPGSLDVFGDGDQLTFSQNFTLATSLIQGNTTFRPPDYELRVAAVGNISYADVGERGALNVDPSRGTTRTDDYVGVQELFLDKHLWNKSANYDFDSLRAGIQPFISDFRGFLYQDQQPGIRLFGNFAKNRYQYNLAWFRRLEKDTNSGLNRAFDLRADDVLIANAFFQDVPVLGFVIEAVVAYNRNREGGRAPHFNRNGFLERPASIGEERPHDYDVVYTGVGGDGHIARINLTTMAYGAFGKDDRHPIAGRQVDIRAYLVTAEGSVDFDWYRLKLFTYHASGDSDPFDGTASGFDAIFENPNFAGGDTSVWQRQAFPLTGGGGVVLAGRNALLPALRSSKEEGQSNFVNPGLLLIGIGGDFDLTPELRLTTNLSHLNFDETAALRTLRQQATVAREIGYDLSAAVIWRPLFTQNVVVRASGGVLVPGQGLDDLYDRYGVFYSTFINVVLTY